MLRPAANFARDYEPVRSGPKFRKTRPPRNMGYGSDGQLVVILVVSLALLGPLMVLCRPKYRGSVWELASDLWSVTSKLVAGSATEDAMSQKVRELSSAFRVRTLQSSMLAASMLSSLCLLNVLWKTIQEKSRWMSPVQDVVFICAHVVTLVVAMLPSKVVERSLHFWISWLMLCGVVFVSPFATSSVIPWHMHVANALLRILCWNLSHNDRVGVFWNLLIAISSTMTACLVPEGRPETVGLADELVSILADFVLISLLGGMVRRLHVAELKLTIEARHSSIELSAGRSLLDALCDAVVELDSTLQMVHHVPRLADLLLHGASRLLEGRKLTDFAASDDDVKRMLSSMRVPTEMNESVADAVHVRLRDSTSVGVEVQMFHVGYLDVVGRPRHVVGIKEHSDFEPRHPIYPTPHVVDRGNQQPALLDTSNPARVELPPDFKLIVNMKACSLDVSDVPDALSYLRGTGFETCLSADSQPGFQEQYQRRLHDFLETSVAKQTASLGTIGLQLSSRYANELVTAQCQVCFYSELDLPMARGTTATSDDEDEPLAIVELTQIRQVPRHCGRHGNPPWRSQASTSSTSLDRRSSHATQEPEPRAARFGRRAESL